jgi:hypothetical protein
MSKEVSKKIDRLELKFDQVTRTKSLLNQNQVQKLWNATPRRSTFDRPAKGGGRWTYVKVGYVRQVLDSVFGFDWSFDIETSATEAYEIAKVTGVVVLKGTLIGNVVDDTNRIRTIKKTQFGRSEVKFKKERDELGQLVPLDFGNDLKGAASDCLKKCASLLGIASDIYDGEDFINITIIDADVNSTRAKATAKKVEEVKKELVAEEVTE